MRRAWRPLRLGVVVAALLLTAYGGLFEGIDALRSVSTPGQELATFGQLLYGACAVAVLLSFFLRRRWIMPLVTAWGVALTITGGLAAVVWGGTGPVVGVFAGVSVAVVAGLFVWACRAHNRDRAREDSIVAEAPPA